MLYTLRHTALATQQRNAFTLRMHRALSWLQRAEAAGDDDDVAFICLWIAPSMRRMHKTWVAACWG